tara:strand:- start:1132 stop:1392 length:261 start_codon:yes stop_codon:yes gene_type:complete
MKMASSKDKLTEKQLREGIMSAVLGSILKGRTSAVLKAFANDPILKKHAQELDKAVKKFDKSVKKARDINKKKLKAAGVPRITAFD